MYKVGIVGYGYVGKGMRRLFSDWVTTIYDPGYIETDGPNYKIYSDTKNEFKDVDLAVICVPTPMMKDGRCDTSIVEASVKWLKKVNKNITILCKSTVEVGTTDRLNKKYGGHIVFSPEYMGEGKYFTPPWMYPDPVDPTSHGFMVMGGESEDTDYITNMVVKRMGPHTKFVYLTAREAEVVKYWENIWGAMKVIFSNHMYDCMKALGNVSYNRAREGWAADPRVERMHTAVFEKARGFSGKCFPKDLRGFIYAVEKAGFDPKLLKLIWNLNCEYRPDEFKPIK